jgi:hypothetical protein
MRTSPQSALKAFLELVAERAKFVDEPDGRKALEAAFAALDILSIRDALAVPAVQAGVRPDALADVLARAEEAWGVGPGGPVLRDGRYSRKRPHAPMSIEEWMEDLRSSAPHLFQSGRL